MATRLLTVLIKSKSNHIKGNRPADLSLSDLKNSRILLFTPHPRLESFNSESSAAAGFPLLMWCELKSVSSL